MNLKSLCLALLIIIPSKSLWAAYKIKKISSSKNRIIISAPEADILTLKKGDSFKIESEFGDSCFVTVIKVKGKSAIGDSSKCTFKADLKKGQSLALEEFEVKPESPKKRYQSGNSSEEAGLKVKYNSVSVQYESSKSDGISESLTGYSIGGSGLLSDQVLFSASYVDLSLNSLSLTAFSFGGDYVFAIKEGLDFLVGVLFISAQVEALGLSDSDTSTGVSVSLKSRLAKAFQGSISLTSSEGNIISSISAELLIGSNAGLAFSFANGESSSSYSLGYRYFF